MDKTSTNNGMVVGLDIGTTKIATVIGFRNDNGQIEVVGYGKSESSGVEFGEIKNILKTTEGITLSKDIATQRSNQEIESVYAGIAGHHIKTSKYNHILYRHGLEGGDRAVEEGCVQSDLEPRGGDYRCDSPALPD